MNITQAARAWNQGALTTEVYARHLGSVLYDPKDPQTASPYELLYPEPMAASALQYRLQHGVEFTDRPQIITDLLLRCLQGSFAEVRQLSDVLAAQKQTLPLQVLLTIAARCSHAEIFEFCIEKGGKVDDFVDRALDSNSSPFILQLLFKEDWRRIRTRINALNKYLNESIDKGSDYVEALLSLGATVEPATLNGVACAGDTKSMRLLMSATTQEMVARSGALQSAITLEKRDIVEAILRQGINPNTAEPTRASFDVREGRPGALPLHEAVNMGSVEMVELLMNYGARANVSSKIAFHGWTALELARKRGDETIVRILSASM